MLFDHHVFSGRLILGTVSLGMILALAVAGCGGEERMPTAPVEGKVLLDGEPLQFGSVVFIPEAGPPARGAIQPDGSFRLTTYEEDDGAVLGTHRVEVKCTTLQDPDAPEPDPTEEIPVGESLIPEKYTNYETSGIEREVEEGKNSFELKLSEETAEE